MDTTVVSHLRRVKAYYFTTRKDTTEEVPLFSLLIGFQNKGTLMDLAASCNNVATRRIRIAYWPMFRPDRP